jgi:hypothetical protein
MKETPSLPTTKAAGNLYPAGEAASVCYAISSVIRSSVLDKNTTRLQPHSLLPDNFNGAAQIWPQVKCAGGDFENLSCAGYPLRVITIGATNASLMLTSRFCCLARKPVSHLQR